MSHFSVMVIGENVAELLQPYHEFECTGTNDQYVQNVDVTDERREEFEKYKAKHNPEGLDNAVTVESFCEYYGYACASSETLLSEDFFKWGWVLTDWRNQEIKQAVRRTNPNAKWDWWMEGGRYSSRLTLKDGTQAGSALKRDIDLDAMQAAAENKARTYLAALDKEINGEQWMTWEKCQAHYPDMGEARTAYNAQPVIRRLRAISGPFTQLDRFLDLDKEQYIADARANALSTFAVCSEKGWTEQGEMGWWGCVSNEKDNWEDEFAKLWSTVGDDELVTIVGCHI